SQVPEEFPEHVPGETADKIISIAAKCIPNAAAPIRIHRITRHQWTCDRRNDFGCRKTEAAIAVIRIKGQLEGMAEARLSPCAVAPTVPGILLCGAGDPNK